MLVLTREAKERILLGHKDAAGNFVQDVVLTVVKIDPTGRRVRLGIEAGQDIVIVREELLQQRGEKP